MILMWTVTLIDEAAALVELANYALEQDSLRQDMLE